MKGIPQEQYPGRDTRLC